MYLLYTFAVSPTGYERVKPAPDSV